MRISHSKQRFTYTMARHSIVEGNWAVAGGNEKTICRSSEDLPPYMHPTLLIFYEIERPLLSLVIGEWAVRCQYNILGPRRHRRHVTLSPKHSFTLFMNKKQ